MNHLDLFSGIGGFRIALDLCRIPVEHSFHSDIEDHANQVYAKNYPDSVPLGDVQRIDGRELRERHPGPWILTGGFPCQDISDSGKTPALPNGFSWNKVSIDPEEGQYSESRIHQMRDCQRLTRTPPTISNDYERQTWSNIQYSRMEYVQNTIRPLVVSVEQELQRKLISDKEHYVEHVLEGLLRGSFTEQVDALTKAVNGPIYTANEARRILGLPAQQNGDTLNVKGSNGSPQPANAA